MADEKTSKRKYDPKEIGKAVDKATTVVVTATDKLAKANPKLKPIAVAAKNVKRVTPYVEKAVELIPDEAIDKAIDTAAKGASAVAEGAKKGASKAGDGAKKAASKAKELPGKAKELPGKAADKVKARKQPKYYTPVPQDDDIEDADYIIVDAEVEE